MAKEQYSNLRAITAWDDGEDIKLVCKTPSGKRGTKTIKDFEWYFAMKRSDADKPVVAGILNKYYQRGLVIRIEEFNDTFVKVYAHRNVKWSDLGGKTGNQKATDDLRRELEEEGVTLFEADLSKWKRFMVDNFIEVDDQLSILYFDIETDDSHDGIEIGRDTILSWAAINTEGVQYFESCKEISEEEMLKRLILVIHEHDVISGWNSEGFDLPYIQARMKKYGLTYDWKRKMHVDLMQRCVKVYSYGMYNMGLQGFALNEVARVFLGEEKIKHEEGIKEMFDNNFELLKRYNIKDTTLLRDLDQKLLIIDLMVKECKWTGSFLDRFYIGELLDNYILRRTRELESFQTSRPVWHVAQQRKNIKIRGGYVMTPVEGLHENVRTFDFKSLYPSIIVGWNIGQDSLIKNLSDAGFVAMCDFLNVGTKEERKIEDVPFEEWKAFLAEQKQKLDPENKYIQAANNSFFERDRDSFIGGLVQHLLDLRAQWRNQAKQYKPGSPEFINFNQSQGMVKEMANSMYGITADKSSRYFNQHVAEAITLTGQYLNRQTSYFAKLRGYSTIYGDTDSIFIRVDDDADCDALASNLNSDLKNFVENEVGSKHNIVFLEYEKKFSKLIMQDKKRYTGRVVLVDGNPTDKIFSRGTENIKKNTIEFARKAIIKLIETVVREEMTLEQAHTFVQELREKTMTEDIPPEDLLILTRVSKSPDKYGSKSVHVRLAERLINEGKLLPISESSSSWGTRLQYITVLDKNTGKNEGILLEEFTGDWDRNYYWDVQVYAPIQRALEAVWPNEDWSGYTVAELEKRARLKEREEKRTAKELELAKKKEERAAKKAASEAKKAADLAEKEAKKKAKEEAKQMKLF